MSLARCPGREGPFEGSCESAGRLSRQARVPKIYPKAFTLKTEDPRIPGQNIIDELKAVAATGTEGDGNAVAFLDTLGNLVLCLPGREKVAPVRTPFMEVTRRTRRPAGS